MVLQILQTKLQILHFFRKVEMVINYLRFQNNQNDE